MRKLILAGFEVVTFNEAADISIINTCTVTENGDKDAKRLVSKSDPRNFIKNSPTEFYPKEPQNTSKSSPG